ncbi:MAG: SHOCT domain-containing protein [bacterium]|nr:SHOCT domain-containing protein [bacterium]
MKKYLPLTIFFFTLSFAFPVSSFAQGMMGGFSNTKVDWNEVVEHTAREEQEGKELWTTLQAKEVTCENLSDEQFGILGEYFMGQMAGESHVAMNAMMIQSHGENGEEQIHIVMGKRLSGCDTSAAFPAISGGWMPMMMGGWSSPFTNNQSNNYMMNFGFTSFSWFGWIFMILWWVLIIAGIITIIKWFVSQARNTRNHEKSSLEILKERYAKGEIDKKEFEEKKKDLA